MSEMTMSATKVKVASQTMCQDRTDVRPADDACDEGDAGAREGGPADAEAPGLPDDEDEGGDEDREREHGRSGGERVRWSAGSRAQTAFLGALDALGVAVRQVQAERAAHQVG